MEDATQYSQPEDSVLTVGCPFLSPFLSPDLLLDDGAES